MKIEVEQRGKYLLVAANGRLDASWADHFTEALLLQIREGHHHLVIDASDVSFLSSAGIRALLKLSKELDAVMGRLCIVNSSSFVDQTLSTSGFQMWLAEAYPDDMPATESAEQEGAAGQAGIQHYTVHDDAVLMMADPIGWLPWQKVGSEQMQTVACSGDTCALGIGSAIASFDEARDHFGEFLAVGGNVVYQPPDEEAPPDYLIAEQEFLPQMQCLQTLHWSGDMKHLIRFAPTDAMPFHSVSDLLALVLEQTEQRAAGFIVLGEVEGLVGTSLIQSPGRIEEEREIAFPEIREWLTFCAERSFARRQALLVGVVSPTGGPLLPPMPSRSGMAAHIHAAVFPYQPLPNGEIEWRTSTEKFFDGPSPLAVMHLTVDDRPAVGLGESALVRGACWCGHLQNPEVLL